MKNILKSKLEESKKAVKYWWLILLLGVLIFVMGIIIFMYPSESYIELSTLFGLIILISGIFQIVLFASSKNMITGRGWVLASGIIEVILGIILSFNILLSASTLPIFLGFWLMFRSFSLIGLASDMSTLKIKGSGWTIFNAILLMILSVIILVQPLVFGVGVVIIWVGISFLFAGITVSMFAFQLKNLHNSFLNQ